MGWFGNQNIESTPVATELYSRGCKFVVPSGQGGAVQSISWYLQLGEDRGFKVALYDEDLNLLAQGEASLVDEGTKWYTINLTSHPVVSEGSTYWLCGFAETRDTSCYSYRSAGDPSQAFYTSRDNLSYDNFPADPAQIDAYNDYIYSVYCTTVEVEAPTVSTLDAINIQTTQAQLNGEITDSGGVDVTERGFEWGTSPGSYPNSWTETGTFGTGTFSHTITDLIPKTTYYFRAKAYNSEGWGYGSELSFTTSVETKTGSFNFLWKLWQRISSSFLFKWALVKIEKFLHLTSYTLGLQTPTIMSTTSLAPVAGYLDSLRLTLANTGISGQTVVKVQVNGTTKISLTIPASQTSYRTLIQLDSSLIRMGDIITLLISEVATDVNNLDLKVYQRTFDSKIKITHLFNSDGSKEYKSSYYFIQSSYWVAYLSQPVKSVQSCYLITKTGEQSSLTATLDSDDSSKVLITPPDTIVTQDEYQIIINGIDYSDQEFTATKMIYCQDSYSKCPLFMKDITSFMTYLTKGYYQYSWDETNWATLTKISNGQITVDPENSVAGGSSIEGQRTLYLKYRLKRDLYLEEQFSVGYYYTDLKIQIDPDLQFFTWTDFTPLSKVDIYENDQLVKTETLVVGIQGFTDLSFKDLDTLNPKCTLSSGKISFQTQVYSFDTSELSIDVSDAAAHLDEAAFYAVCFDSLDQKLKVVLLSYSSESILVSDISTSRTLITLWVFSLLTNDEGNSVIGFRVRDSYKINQNRLDLTQYTGDIKLIFSDLLGRSKTISYSFLTESLKYDYGLKVYTDDSRTTEIKQGEIHSNSNLFYYIE